ncbi:MAG: DoxX family protein [Polyangiaceae bacterium]
MTATLTVLPASTPSKARTRAGVAVSAVPALFLVFDAAMKLALVGPVRDSFEQMQIPVHLARGIGALELALVALYAIPRTAALGMLLLTGYLGGALALHLRLGDPLFSHTMFPVYVGVALGGGLALRDRRVGALFAA